jgi:hypothetical protein
MSDKFFIDTNILAYAQLWNSGGGVLSTQVLEELCVNLRRKTAHPLSLEQTHRLLHDYSSWDIVINTAESVIEALVIEHRYNISFPACAPPPSPPDTATATTAIPITITRSIMGAGVAVASVVAVLVRRVYFLLSRVPADFSTRIT